MSNIYQPDLMEVVEVRQQTADVKSVRIRFRDEEKARRFSFRVGQFGIFSAFGYGESVFNICSSSNWKEGIEFCFRKVGRVTEALWDLEEGDRVMHERFGEGEVISVEGESPNTTALINFRTAGTKKLLLRFAKLTRL